MDDFLDVKEDRFARLPAYPDSDSSGRFPFCFALAHQFKTHAEVINYLSSTQEEDKYLNVNGVSGFFTYGKITTDIREKFDKPSNNVADIFTKPNQSTTEPGGNDAINCYWQFSWDDDIVPPLLSAAKGADAVDPVTGGLGRVYSEMYNNTQQLLHITVGVPEYSNLTDFYANMFDNDLAKLVRGDNPGLASSLGRLAGSAFSIGVRVITSPYRYLRKLSNLVTDTKVGRYCDFHETMLLYYRYVNSILINLAVNMGFMPPVVGTQEDSSTNGEQSNAKLNQLFDPINKKTLDENPENLLPIFRGGFDIWRILSVRDNRTHPGNGSGYDSQYSSDATFLGAEKSSTNPKDKYMPCTFPEDMWKAFVSRTIATWQCADKFVSFKIEKSTDSSESISNSTGESQIQQYINQQSDQARAAKHSVMFGETGVNGIDAVVGALRGFANGIIESVEIAANPLKIVGGYGKIDIPEEWQTSSFSKSYSFNLTLRAPYGDNYTVFQSIYIPLAMLIALALPRSVGKSSYIQPFVIRAYSKGMFAIPYGMIESMTIRRGSSEFGWNTSRLPTVVEVNFTIKDLSPTMHLAMSTGMNVFNLVDDIFGENSSFQEYLMTLSGLGLAERLLWAEQLKKRINTIFYIAKSTIANPLFWGSAVGDTTPGKLIGVFSPYIRYKD